MTEIGNKNLVSARLSGERLKLLKNLRRGQGRKKESKSEVIGRAIDALAEKEGILAQRTNR